MREIWGTARDATVSAVVDDNGEVAYLYVVREGEIVGDVWLYNHGAAPTTPEWFAPERVPFRNPVGFAVEAEVAPIEDASEVRFEWRETTDGIRVDLYLRGRHIATTGEGLRPGYCVFAAQDGPLALRMRKSA